MDGAGVRSGAKCVCVCVCGCVGVHTEKIVYRWMDDGWMDGWMNR